MTSRFMRYLSLGLAALLAFAMLSGTADAKKKRGVGKSVDSSEIEDGTIQCADISAAVFPNGCPDDDSGAGTGTGTGTGGTGGSGAQSFDANLGPNQTKVVNAGQFIVSTAADNTGACGPIQINNLTASAAGLTDEPADDTAWIVILPGVAGQLTTAASQLAPFAGTTLTGTNSVSGIVGTLQVVATSCLTFGHVTAS